jgi:hypothetical protein
LWGKWPDLQLLGKEWGDRLLHAERTGASSIGNRLLVRSSRPQSSSTGVASRHIRVHSQSDTCPIFQTWPERSRRKQQEIVRPIPQIHGVPRRLFRSWPGSQHVGGSQRLFAEAGTCRPRQHQRGFGKARKRKRRAFGFHHWRPGLVCLGKSSGTESEDKSRMLDPIRSKCRHRLNLGWWEVSNQDKAGYSVPEGGGHPPPQPRPRRSDPERVLRGSGRMASRWAPVYP